MSEHFFEIIIAIACAGLTWAIVHAIRYRVWREWPPLLVGCGFAFGLYLAMFEITIAVAPHSSGDRPEVSWIPWPAFVSLPPILAFVGLGVLGILIPRRSWSGWFVLGFNVVLACLHGIGSQLLRRDFVGKL